MNNLLKQAQKMQRDMETAKEALTERFVEATAGGGAVKVVTSCDYKIKEITLSPDVVDPDDIEMLQDLIIAAINEAMRKAEETSQSEMAKITGGLNGMPGLF
jgi:DNA-binding YbaB/EbfC family protein